MHALAFALLIAHAGAPLQNREVDASPPRFVYGIGGAALGAVVGTATGAVTRLQQVLVVNDPASPIPVTGTVSVGNLPETQPVSGTVNVGNLPAVHLANKVFSEQRLGIVAGGISTFDFGRTINVSTLIVDNRGADDDTTALHLRTAAGTLVLVREGDGSFIQNFTMPVPATGVIVTCFNLASDNCDVEITALGS